MNTNNPTCHCGKTLDFDGQSYVCACQSLADPAKQAQNAYAYVVDKPIPDFDSII